MKQWELQATRSALRMWYFDALDTSPDSQRPWNEILAALAERAPARFPEFVDESRALPASTEWLRRCAFGLFDKAENRFKYTVPKANRITVLREQLREDNYLIPALERRHAVELSTVQSLADLVGIKLRCDAPLHQGKIEGIYTGNAISHSSIVKAVLIIHHLDCEANFRARLLTNGYVKSGNEDLRDLLVRADTSRPDTIASLDCVADISFGCLSGLLFSHKSRMQTSRISKIVMDERQRRVAELFLDAGGPLPANVRMHKCVTERLIERAYEVMYQAD